MRKEKLTADDAVRKETPAAQPELFEGGKQLDRLATALREELAQVEAHARGALMHALVAGGLLLQVKSELPHGEWLPWLTANVPRMSVRSAQVYMRLAKHALAFPGKYADPAHLSIESALTMLTAPPPLALPAPAIPLPDVVEHTALTFAIFTDAVSDLCEINHRVSQQVRAIPWDGASDPEPAHEWVKATCQAMHGALDELDAAVDSGTIPGAKALPLYAEINKSDVWQTLTLAKLYAMRTWGFLENETESQGQD